MIRRVTRREAIVAGLAMSAAAVTLVGDRPAHAQVEGAPTLLMFHVEAGW